MSRAIMLAYAEEQRVFKKLRRERRMRREISAPLQLPEQDFIRHFRITKSTFQQLTEELRPYMPASSRKTAVPHDLKILAALTFYAHGSYQKNIGLSYLFNMSQPTFSRCLHEVTNALNNPEVLRAHIKFPITRDEREAIMGKFMEKFGFPGIIGCIDGTHIALIRPKEDEEAYFNRKHYHSLNAMIICDAHLNILYIDASFGGASHDSYVWNQSIIKQEMERLVTGGERCWFLGDSGYAQRSWMMTPILGAAPGSPEEHYTNLHCQVRNTVERCIGVLKARWRCLMSHRVLHYDPLTCARIVNACAVLHNIANTANIPAPELPVSDLNRDQQLQVQEVAHHVDVHDSVRDGLVHRLWQSRRVN